TRIVVVVMVHLLIYISVYIYIYSNVSSLWGAVNERGEACTTVIHHSSPASRADRKCSAHRRCWSSLLPESPMARPALPLVSCPTSGGTSISGPMHIKLSTPRKLLWHDALIGFRGLMLQHGPRIATHFEDH